jgi:two-component system, NarL family, sensor histidine kinase DesK
MPTERSVSSVDVEPRATWEAAGVGRSLDASARRRLGWFSANRGDDRIRGPQRWRRGGGFWLIYLAIPLGSAWTHHQLAARIVGTAFLLVFAWSYLFLVPLGWWGARGARYSYLIVGELLLVTAGATAVIGVNGLWMLIFVAAATIILLPGRVALAAVASFAVISAVLPQYIKPWHQKGLQWSMGASVALASLAVFGFSRLIRANAELAAMREEVATLAAERERMRIARDLHDLLGHSLTTVTVKAALASRLFDQDPVRARAEIAEVEVLARESLADVRAAVAGYREVRLATELATAREVLEAAGIDAQLPGVVEGMSSEVGGLFGWVVREGVTNVVRHSHAKSVRITLDATGIEIVDDGSGCVRKPGELAPTHPGNGLAGLAERADALGGRLLAGPVDGSATGFRLRVEVPA